MDIAKAKDRLYSLGLVCVGVSSKSRSTYWAFTNDTDRPRLRLSDHAVAHAISDCAVCLGNALDDDVTLDTEHSVDVAVKLLFNKTVTADMDQPLDDFESENGRTPTEEEQRAIRNEVIAEWREHATRYDLAYAKILFE